MPRLIVRVATRLVVLLLLLQAPALMTAPPALALSCANFLAIDGVMYDRSDWNNEATLGRRLTPNDLGAQYRQVRNNGRSEHRRNRDNPLGLAGCGGSSLDNFSTDLPRGTPLYEVVGYSPTFRLAAVWPGGFIDLFEVGENPTARAGGDLYDIGGKVVAIRLLDHRRRSLTVIDDPASVARLTELMIASPIGDVSIGKPRLQRIVLYHLADGTVAEDRWYMNKDTLTSGIKPPREFGDILEAALADPVAMASPVAATPVAATSAR